MIQPKKDKRGKRYRFVRLKNVEDVRIIAVKLDNIILGNKKIYANVLSHHRGSRDERGIVGRRNKYHQEKMNNEEVVNSQKSQASFTENQQCQK